MTILFNTNDPVIIENFKDFALEKKINFDIIDNISNEKKIALPGNPINNNDLGIYINNSINSGTITIDKFKER